MATKDRYQQPASSNEFEDEEPVELDPIKTYAAGSIGRAILPQLATLIDVYADESRKTEIEAFLRWVPAIDLERFLVHCLSYGADTCHPTRKTRRKIALKPGSPQTPSPKPQSQDPGSGVHVGTPGDPPSPGVPSGGL